MSVSPYLMRAQVADCWPPGHEAAGLPKDGFVALVDAVSGDRGSARDRDGLRGLSGHRRAARRKTVASCAQVLVFHVHNSACSTESGLLVFVLG